MVFSSITFLFFFLPLTLLIYVIAGRKFRNIILLFASLLFYSWGEGIYLLVMLVSILLNYLCGISIIRKGSDSPSRFVLASGIVANIGILAFFKYANFIVDNLNSLFDALSLPVVLLDPVHLPIGISFFTFQAVSYIVDVYRKNVEPQQNLIRLSLYISLFPQLIAGPIVRYHHIARELAERTITTGDFAAGAQRFLYGLSKKVLLANPMGAMADQVFSLPGNELSFSVAWLGAICYTFQIFFDFSGYSDMAIGLGRMVGFHFPENFNYPYISRSIREFWRRWHISLSSWFRDYLYIPMGGNRHGNTRTSVNLLTVFFLCGLWHGASWTFVLWGLYHGLFLTVERTVIGNLLQKLWSPLQHLITIVLIIFGWVIFRSESPAQAMNFFAMMSGLVDKQISAYPIAVLLDYKIIFELFMAMLMSVPLFPLFVRIRDSLTQKTVPGGNAGLAGFYLVQFTLTVTLTYFTVISLAAGAYNPFIYFRF
ncbi:MBOAT family O-acyltransferase [Desulfosediminicola flagellatus]|uniref:MBOAT family O-acyltransferase n=1 Tax=Desulfosediminicola flagellatus TaxID=2569541 RepID=UPI0010AD40F0|nr:MBOAT family O-acyltransferase [Desulfosediminicola flagellatus]